MNKNYGNEQVLHQLWELALLIDEHPKARAHFNFDFYLGSGSIGSAQEAIEMIEEDDIRHCGTVGCLGGFGRLFIPELDGLPLHWSTYAIADALGLACDDAEYLLIGQNYGDPKPSPKVVAARIKEFIEELE